MSRDKEWDEPNLTRSTNPLSPRFHDDFTTTIEAAAYVEAMRYVPTREDLYGDGVPSARECAADERGGR